MAVSVTLAPTAGVVVEAVRVVVVEVRLEPVTLMLLGAGLLGLGIIRDPIRSRGGLDAAAVHNDECHPAKLARADRREVLVRERVDTRPQLS